VSVSTLPTDRDIKSAGGFEARILGNPDFGHLSCTLPPGEALLVESGAMAAMDDGFEVKNRLPGGFFTSMLRKLFGGESAFVGEYTHPEGGTIEISPAFPGAVLHRSLSGEGIFLQGGAFMACTPGLELGVQFGGLKSFFSGEGAFFLNISGQGELFYNAYGAVIERVVDGSFIVDTGHVVGWEPTLDWTVRGMGGLKSTLFSGEGLVIEFSGRGKVWTQTRHLGAFAGWLSGYCRG
jgi:uncharacterized protein (TIGR00266 family)